MTGTTLGLAGGAGALALAAALALVPAARSAPACELPADASRGGGLLVRGDVKIAWRTADGAAPAVSRPFVAEFALCPDTARLVRADAVMPEHRHGMNYRPTLERAAPARWRSEGWVLHMPGRWELRLDVEHGGRVERWVFALDLP